MQLMQGYVPGIKPKATAIRTRLLRYAKYDPERFGKKEFFALRVTR
jgi:hypothetical protein